LNLKIFAQIIGLFMRPPRGLRPEQGGAHTAKGLRALWKPRKGTALDRMTGRCDMIRLFFTFLLFAALAAPADDALVEIRGETLRGYGVLIRHGESAAILTSAHLWLLNDRPEVIAAGGRKLSLKGASLAADRDLALVGCDDLPAGAVRREVVVVKAGKPRSETTFYLETPVKPGDSGRPVYDAAGRVTGIVTGVEDGSRGFATMAAVEEGKWHRLDLAEKKRIFGLIAELKKGPTPERRAAIRREKSVNPALDALLREALRAFQ